MKCLISILLPIILLAGNSYLTIGTHYCRGESTESIIVLGNEIDMGCGDIEGNEIDMGCGDIEDEDHCADCADFTNNKLNFDKDSCCENQYQIIETTEDFVRDSITIIVLNYFAIANGYTTKNLNLFLNSQLYSYTQYFPPPIVKDIQKLFQTFLI